MRPNLMQCSRAACNARSGSQTTCAISSEESTCDDKWGTDVSVRPTLSVPGTWGDSNTPYVSPLLQVPYVIFDSPSKEHCRDRTDQITNNQQADQTGRNLCQKLRGHYQYCGRPTDFRSLREYYRNVRRIWKIWLNRRTRGRTMNREAATHKLITQNPKGSAQQHL